MKQFKLTLALFLTLLLPITLATPASIESPRGKRDAQLQQLLSEVMSESSHDELLRELSPSELEVACSESAAYEDYDIETCESDICCKHFFMGGRGKTPQNAEPAALTIRQQQQQQQQETKQNVQVIERTVQNVNPKKTNELQPPPQPSLNANQKTVNYSTTKNPTPRRAYVPSKPIIIIEGATEKSMPIRIRSKLPPAQQTPSPGEVREAEATTSMDTTTTTAWMTTGGGPLTDLNQETTQAINSLTTTTSAVGGTTMQEITERQEGAITTIRAKTNDSEVLDTKLCQDYAKPAEGQKEEDDSQFSQNFLPQLRQLQKKKKKRPKKTYMEPIGYETKLMHPTPRILLPQNHNFFLDDRQIFQAPQRAYRPPREPPSIYLNNIVSGLDCGDRRNRSKRPCLTYGSSGRALAVTSERPTRNYHFNARPAHMNRLGYDNFAPTKYSSEQSSEFTSDTKESSSDCGSMTGGEGSIYIT